MNILHVVGARPNFMKAAPMMRALAARGARQVLVHTGQHYDPAMSDVFFEQLDLPIPDVNLGVGSGTHAQQTAQIMLRFETVLSECRPDLVVIYGDVNSTLAAALVCSKLGTTVAHVEAGLRSFDKSMPEEINRILTDQVSDLLFTPSPDADANLLREGIAEGRIHRVGNVMIDTLVRMMPKAESVSLPELPRKYALLTLHRPCNVDDPRWLCHVLQMLQGVEIPVMFPVHPRTRARISDLGSNLKNGKLCLLEPLPYLEFLALEMGAALVITDSGGVQEETTFLNIPCLTVRENTERPITISMGSNILIGHDITRLRSEITKIIDGKVKKARTIPLWDGRAADRIAKVILERQAFAVSA